MTLARPPKRHLNGTPIVRLASDTFGESARERDARVREELREKEREKSNAARLAQEKEMFILAAKRRVQDRTVQPIPISSTVPTGLYPSRAMTMSPRPHPTSRLPLSQPHPLRPNETVFVAPTDLTDIYPVVVLSPLPTTVS